jgi:hypothetical protein
VSDRFCLYCRNAKSRDVRHVNSLSC